MILQRRTVAQVAHEARVLDMANADALRNAIGDVKPDIVIPEIEAIATDVLFGSGAGRHPRGAERCHRLNLHGS